MRGLKFIQDHSDGIDQHAKKAIRPRFVDMFLHFWQISARRGKNMEHNCGFTDENRWFRYRAAAIIVEDGCVLFAGNENEDYLYSIGGAVHMGETAEDAVKREVLEETGVEYAVDHLAVIHENFFNENTGSLKGMECHEIALYYMMKPRGTRALHSDSYTMGVRETMHWIPIEKIGQYKAFPTFMKDYLLSDHDGIEHIVTDERI